MKNTHHLSSNTPIVCVYFNGIVNTSTRSFKHTVIQYIISLYRNAARALAYEYHGFTARQRVSSIVVGGLSCVELSARGPRLHPRSHLGRLHPAGSLSLRSAFGMLRRCRYLWRLIPAPASNTKPVIGPRRALAPRSDGIIDWSAPVSMTFLALRFVVVSAGGKGAGPR